MEKKIDRPLVKMSNSNNDFRWYDTMMGRQRQIIVLLKEELKMVNRTKEVMGRINKTLEVHNDMLQVDNDRYRDKYENRVVIFQPWNLIKTKINKDGEQDKN